MFFRSVDSAGSIRSVLIAGVAMGVVVGAATLPAGAADPIPCRSLEHEGQAYTVCEVDLRRQAIKLFWRRTNGTPYGYLRALPRSLDKPSEPLLFATNAGMFNPAYKPVGLYVENGRELVQASTKAGRGNFHLKPNGVFYVAGDKAGVLETTAYLKQSLRADIATQSGPMLVINGRVHPRFAEDSASLKVRSGVGVRDAHTVAFALSEDEVTFRDFALVFRDALKCDNALFLDGGSVPKLHIPAQKRGGNILPMGPMIGVFDKQG